MCFSALDNGAILAPPCVRHIYPGGKLGLLCSVPSWSVLNHCSPPTKSRRLRPTRPCCTLWLLTTVPRLRPCSTRRANTSEGIWECRGGSQRPRPNARNAHLGTAARGLARPALPGSAAGCEIRKSGPWFRRLRKSLPLHSIHATDRE